MNCIFGFFDVLGFTSFCEHCDLNSTEHVLKVIDEFETEIPATLIRALDVQGNVPEDKKELLKNRLKWLTFSDSVFVAMQIDRTTNTEGRKFDLIFFMLLIAYINRRMFELGLPLRGTVHIGDVLVSKRCFAGKPVVVAHQLSAKCEVAAAIISDAAYAFISETFADAGPVRSMISNLMVECDVPIKNDQHLKGVFHVPSQRMKTLCWFYLEMGVNDKFVVPPDLGAFVRAKFTAHGKKLLGHNEQMKAFHTEALFHVWRAASDKQYREQVTMRPT